MAGERGCGKREDDEQIVGGGQAERRGESKQERERQKEEASPPRRFRSAEFVGILEPRRAAVHHVVGDREEVQELQRVAGHEALHAPLRADGARVRNRFAEMQNERIGVNERGEQARCEHERGFAKPHARPRAVLSPHPDAYKGDPPQRQF